MRNNAPRTAGMLLLLATGTAGGPGCGGPAAPTNQAPTIGDIVADAVPVVHAQTTFTAQNVRDPDGDSVSMTWLIDGGSFHTHQEGATAKVMFPVPGAYTVALVAADNTHQTRVTKIVEALSMAGTWHGAYGQYSFTLGLTEDPASPFLDGSFEGDEGRTDVAMAVLANRTVTMQLQGLARRFNGTIDPSGNAVSGTVTVRGAEVAFEMHR